MSGLKRIKLQMKPSQKLKLRSTEEDLSIVTERTDEYPYLRFYRPEETISRIDRYSVDLHWEEYNDVLEDSIRAHALIFYPSDAAENEIKHYIQDIQRENTNATGKALSLIHRWEQLKDFANPWWHTTVDFILNKNNWLINDILDRIHWKDYNHKMNNNHEDKPIVKLQLQAKNEYSIKKYKLISEPKKIRMTLKTR